MNTTEPEPVPAAIVERDVELRQLRAELPPSQPTIAPLVERLRAMAIRTICEREGMSEAEATAIVDAPPKLEAEADRARERHELREANVRRRMDDLALPISPPALYDDVVARCVPQVQATKIAGDWLRSVRAQMRGEATRPSRVLVLLGGMGLAKTASAGLCASQFIRWGHTVAYVEESELVRLSERRVIKHEERLEEVLDADLLIIDELGTSTADPTKVREAFRDAVNQRVRRFTVMLGNLADDLPDDADPKVREKHASDRFATTYGARLVDRLVQMGTVAHLVGKSMRGTPYVSPRAKG